MAMWMQYAKISARFPKLSLAEERCLIARAKKGSTQSAEEVVLRHIGFVVFRLHRRGFPSFIRKYGEDVVAASVPLLYEKMKTYNLRYRDSRGDFKPVRFRTYIWKRIDGFIVDSLKLEMRREKLEVELHDMGLD